MGEGDYLLVVLGVWRGLQSQSGWGIFKGGVRFVMLYIHHGASALITEQFRKRRACRRVVLYVLEQMHAWLAVSFIFLAFSFYAVSVGVAHHSCLELQNFGQRT